jgi:hypothetical protein
MLLGLQAFDYLLISLSCGFLKLFLHSMALNGLRFAHNLCERLCG